MNVLQCFVFLKIKIILQRKKRKNMSIELQEARKKLDIFEKGANNPEIFMSASFAELSDTCLDMGLHSIMMWIK